MVDFCRFGLNVIEIEARAIFELSKKIDASFEQACQRLMSCRGRVILTGMGKSGHIAKKISSTLSSVGTPSFFLHPAEASHGDLGMITQDDVMIIVSYSGKTPEILSILSPIKQLGVTIIALTGHPESTIATNAHIHLNIAVEQEACPLGLAPTTSTTVSLVMGDALAISLLQAKGFTQEDFARSHPGGQLGKRLLLRVKDIWHTGHAMPLVPASMMISDALIEVTNKKLGMACVTNDTGELLGIFTDGDIRRTLNKRIDIHHTPIASVTTTECKTIHETMLATEALNTMQKYTISSLVVINEKKHPIGVVHLHDLLKSGVL